MAAQLLEFALDRDEHRVVRVGERFDAFGDQLFGDVVQGDLLLRERFDHGASAVDLLEDRVGDDDAVVEQRFERVRRDRVDGILRDERLDVHQLRIRRVLGRGRGPERALHVRALDAQRGESVAFEQLLEALIGQFGAGDRGFAEQVLDVFAAVDLGLQLLVDGGVDARDEDRGDRRDPIDRLAARGALFQSFDVGVGGRFVPVDREQQGDVDVDAGCDRGLDRGDAFPRSRDLDHHVGPIDRLPKTLRRGDRSLGVASKVRRDFERDVAVQRVRRLVDRREEVARAAHGGRVALVHQRAQLLVVVGPGPDRLLEDRRIRGHPAQTEVDEPLQLARSEHAAPDVVEPDALADGRKFSKLIAHVVLFPQTFASRPEATSATCSGVKPNSLAMAAAGADAPK